MAIKYTTSNTNNLTGSNTAKLTGSISIGPSQYATGAVVNTIGYMSACTDSISTSYAKFMGYSKFNVAGVDLFVYNAHNKYINIQNLDIRFKNTENGVDVIFSPGDFLKFRTLSEASTFIKKLKFMAKKAQQFKRECEMSTDFM